MSNFMYSMIWADSMRQYFSKNRRKLIIQRTDISRVIFFVRPFHAQWSFSSSQILLIFSHMSIISLTLHISNPKFANVISSLFFATSFELLHWLISDKKCWNMTWARKLVRHFVWDFLCWPGQVSSTVTKS